MAQLFDADGEPLNLTGDSMDDDIKELPSGNFPPPTPKPEWFDKELLKIGGFVPGAPNIPRYRVVWGMDNDLRHFAMGKMRIKYPTMIDTVETTIGIRIREFGKEEKYIPAAQAIEHYYDRATGTWTKAKNPNVIIAPVIRSEEIETGTPLWIVEQFVEPEGFGTPSQWEANRYLINPTNPLEYIDAIGEFPSKGRYIEWLQLFDVDEEGKPMYMELGEAAIEYIRANHVLNVARRKRLDEYDKQKAFEDRDNKQNEYWEAQRNQVAREILDVKKNKVHSLPGQVKLTKKRKRNGR